MWPFKKRITQKGVSKASVAEADTVKKVLITTTGFRSGSKCEECGELSSRDPGMCQACGGRSISAPVIIFKAVLRGVCGPFLKDIATCTQGFVSKTLDDIDANKFDTSEVDKYRGR